MQVCIMDKLYLTTVLVLLCQFGWVSYAASTMPDYCLEPAESGRCEAATSRWYYNKETGECEEFTYGGCEGNKNNFRDKEACAQTCTAACGNKMCMMECPNGFKRDEQGCAMCACNPEVEPACDNKMCMIECPSGFKLDEQGCTMCECNPEVETACDNKMCMMECPNGFKLDERGCTLCECKPELALYTDKCEGVICEAPLECRVFELTMSRHKVSRCVDPAKPEQCQAPMDAGPCKATKSRWFYNSEENECQEFMFGGCRGNTNNFQDMASCQQTCIDGIDAGDGEVNKCGMMMCMMHCEAGFKKDSRGCDLCECEEVCPQDTVCGLSCRHGYKKDDNGCSLCECLDKPPCLKDIVCAMECKYGLVVLEDGCQLCECQKEPCSEVECETEERCENKVSGGKWTGTCVSLHETKPWCGPEMCAMYCENGFALNQYGCPMCECLEQAPPVCTLEICEVGCPYGMSYNRNGCRTCECLPSPCQLDTCPLTEACEVKVRDDCPSCPSTFACLTPDEVKRVSVSLEYFWKKPQELSNKELLELKNEFHRQLSDLMGIDRDVLQGLKVQPPSEATVSISFHLVSFREDVVVLYEGFKEKINHHTDHSTVMYDDQQLIPEHGTLAAQYHSDMEVPPEDQWEESDDETEEENMTQTITIVAAVAGGCIALVVIAVILVAIIRSKTKHKGQYQKHKNSKNVIYKKAPASEQA